MEIIAIITTKNRTKLFARALQSVLSQTRRADEIIVVTDSTNENKEVEKQLIKNSGVTILDDKNAHNYAGSLNTAIHYILQKNLFLQKDYKNTYVAFLDDDDIWLNTYLEKGEKSIQEKDFLVSGLIYRNEDGAKQLSIPQILTVDSFLKGNPHIQGSNTFVKLEILLKAGLFDENMSSTTDRDIFTRIMLLHPTYSILNEYLVEVNAYNDRERITNGKDRKTDGLRKFYYKYNGYMSDDIKEAFFTRAKRLFDVDKTAIETVQKRVQQPFDDRITTNGYNGKLIIGFIATEYKLGLRLLEQLVALHRSNTKIVIFINFTEDRAPYISLLKASGYQYEIVDKNRVLARIRKCYFDQLVSEEKLMDDTIQDIAITRTILQNYLYQLSKEGDVIWILDEDMELKELVLQNGNIENVPLNINNVIATYKDDYDAVVGNYSLDAPLPTLSTIRTALLDYVYNKTASIGNVDTLSDKTDYYYDLTDYGKTHLETPIVLKNDCNLDEVFSGKAYSRPLYLQDTEIKEVKSRGGNTLIFNRELLKIPNWSIQIGDKIGRRSDYFWVLQAKKAGYKIVNVPFATLHNRRNVSFNMQKEEEKLLLDLIGSSFTKAVEKIGVNANKNDFYNSYREYFVERLVKYSASFRRIQGLLSIINDIKYSALFSDFRLLAFIKEASTYLEFNKVVCAFESLNYKLHIHSQLLSINEIKAKIENKFSLSNDILVLLGSGSEGVVFTDGTYVYKYFYNPLKNIDFLKRVAHVFNECEALYPLEFFQSDGTDIIRYTYEKSKPYNGGHIRQFIDFLQFLKKNGCVFDNIKGCNFVVANGKLKLIDYGKSFLPFDTEKYNKSVIRAFELLRYPFLSEEDFKRLIQRYYQGDSQYIDNGCELFRKVVDKRYKEDLHDKKVISIVNQYNPKKILDYGAGKCKIANKLSEKYDVSVFDIDLSTIAKRANHSVTIYKSADNIPSARYDLVISNLVLCCIDNNIADEVVRNIVRILKLNGQAIISICNPFFNSVQNTELRTTGLQGNYHISEMFEKHSAENGKIRKEYHRPIEFYKNLFSKYGLRIEQIVEGDGADIDTLMPISEHIIFDCKKISEPQVFDNLSLLIKTNPMEHRSVYRNISHIVGSLEKGGRFLRKVVVADLTWTSERVRRYDLDDEEALEKELQRAKANNLIDDIIYAKNDEEEIKNIYKKYFGLESSKGHCANGQGLYATLCGFENIKTEYVFQTDSDILYHNEDVNGFLDGLKALKKGAITVTLSIAKKDDSNPVYGCRTEVRSCFLALHKLKSMLPIKNHTIEGIIQLPWHRALDQCLQEKDSIRLSNKNVWFIHPENDKKQEFGFISYVERRIEQNQIPDIQYNQVNLSGNKKDWLQTTNANVVIYIRGYNTAPEKLKRLFDSLRYQTYQNFSIVYVDDASQNDSADYAEFVLRYDNYFKSKMVVSIFNDTNVGELENFVFVMQSVIMNPDCIVINLDNDDYLVNPRAIEIIINEFNNGAEITCGNCIRYDKPLKIYKIYSFERVWERGGDNIWLHPKCFKRKLFDLIDIENDLKIDGSFVEVNTDFAFMLPMISKSKKNVFISEILYYFEPSTDNINHLKKYNKQYKQRIKNILLKKAKDRDNE